LVSLSGPSGVISSRCFLTSNGLDVIALAADISYPVPPEVGKVGKESPTFIQPVSERSDGIKSFFNKQSPAKTKVKAEPETTKSSTSTRPKESVKDEIKEEAKVDPEGIKSEITPKDEEKGLGDDSNAPNPDPSSDIEFVNSSDSKAEVKKEVKNESSAKEEKKEEKEEEREEKEDLSTTLTMRKRDEKGGAGQRTKVIRRDDDSKSAVCLRLHSRTIISSSFIRSQYQTQKTSKDRADK
jgi:hypothetical protein